jgi:hypothetical protein
VSALIRLQNISGELETVKGQIGSLEGNQNQDFSAGKERPAEHKSSTEARNLDALATEKAPRVWVRKAKYVKTDRRLMRLACPIPQR